MPRFAILLLMIGLPGISGCYSLVPAELGSVPTGAPVRAHLIPDGSAAETALTMARLESRFAIDGRFVEARTDQVILEIPSAEREIGTQTRMMYERIVLERSAIDRVEVRRVDRLRTGALFGVMGGVVIALLVKSMRVVDPGGAPPPPPNGEL